MLLPMSVKIIEVLRAIRDKHYEETKTMSIEEQIAFYRHKSELLQKELKFGSRDAKNETNETE